jgi:hypothetical protein
MWLHEKEKKNYKPRLLDYWMTTEVKENLKKDPNPEKKYTKLDSFSGSKIKSNKSSKYSIHYNI